MICEHGIYADWPLLRDRYNGRTIMHQLTNDVYQYRETAINLPLLAQYAKQHADEGPRMLAKIDTIVTKYRHLLPVNDNDRFGQTAIHGSQI